MYKGLGHIALTVADMDASISFYCRQLGFEEAFAIHDDEGNPWIEYIKIAPGQFIELFHGGRVHVETAPGTIGFNHLCVEVTDMAALVRHLNEQGVPIDVGPLRGKDFNEQCWVTDPDGNPIEFMAIDPRSPHVKS
ncbi:VOC family protein [Salisediminibacterium selenitireducens]|uniref:Glyoxalase/bleomycin resistance protein/dioxygenase n=1 Tax=Bacillus selenitireducens (strain ATCC 700615 / DSM 15326 / MLS10) TaxID=439292 RepID=D6XWH6_BACIE|nr:VOC family protein [Salisediminibacterium selenitireducens]ADH97818.1 Glyoxalase/bleomycin resistance protein/dioxygenase [[Bacillus] selenitireducens MLS10]